MLRPKRTEWIEISTIDEAHAVIASRPRLKCVLVDVDNTLIPYGAPAARESALIDSAIERVLSIDHVDELIIQSNAGPTRPGPSLPLPDRVHVAWGIGKPWVASPSSAPGSATVVIGDLDLIDGLWARRIGAAFIKLSFTDADPQWSHRLIRRLGRLLQPVLFKTLP